MSQDIGKFDLVIIGSGIIEAMIAYEAVQKGLKTALLRVEKSRNTAWSGGRLRPQIPSEKDSSCPTHLVLFSGDLYEDVVANLEGSIGLTSGFQKIPRFIVATALDRAQGLDELRPFASSSNMHSMLGANKAPKQWVPELAGTPSPNSIIQAHA